MIFLEGDPPAERQLAIVLIGPNGTECNILCLLQPGDLDQPSDGDPWALRFKLAMEQIRAVAAGEL